MNNRFDYDADIETQLAGQVLDEEELAIENHPEIGNPVTGERLEKILLSFRRSKEERLRGEARQHLSNAVFGR